MSKPKRDRTTGLPLPSPVVPLTSICLTIQVPNALEYRSALKGVLSELGKSWTWSQTAGEDNQDAYTAAELWRARLANAVYDLECAEPMSCADVADCIDENPAVQAAIAQQIANNVVNQTTVYETSNYGVPMLPGAYNAPVITSVGCEPNSLFGSVTAIVDQMDKNNRDFLEIIEVGTNTRERVSTLIAAIPAFETLPINEAIDYIDKLQSEILENYEAQWTEALKDTYRCDLFCIAYENEDCELTFDQIQQYFDGRLGAALDPVNLFAAMVQYFISGTWAGSTVVDIMMLTQVSFWRSLSNWGGVSLRTLQTVGLLGANDDNPDWEILCEDCAPEPPDDCESFQEAAWGWAPAPGGYGVRDSGGLAGELYVPDGLYYFWWNFSNTSLPNTYTEITLNFNQPITDFELLGQGGYMIRYTGAPVSSITATEATKEAGVPFPFGHTVQWTMRTLGTHTVPGSFRVQEICKTPA